MKWRRDSKSHHWEGKVEVSTCACPNPKRLSLYVKAARMVVSLLSVEKGSGEKNQIAAAYIRALHSRSLQN